MRARFVLAATFLIPLVLVARAEDDTPGAPAPAAAPADDGILGVGDAAPSLTIAEWVKGDPVEKFEPGRIYVVEFWATWCGPCVAGMPHLSAVQAEYRDHGVTVIGVSSADRNGNSLPKVKRMVADKGDTMAYTVAWDRERATNDAWMLAARRNGIPCCFVVDGTGHIAYVGHPMWLDIPLAHLAKGDFDAAACAAEVAGGENALDAAFGAMRNDPAAALEQLDAFAERFPAAASQFADTRFALAVRAGDAERIAKLADVLVAEGVARRDAQRLNGVAWALVDPATPLAERHLDLALEAASAANALSGGNDAAVLDTLARVYHWRGDVSRAITLQKKAVAIATAEGGDAALAADLQRTLAEYEKGAK